MKKILSLTATLLASGVFAADLPNAQAFPVQSDEITLDGKLTEAVWSKAPQYSGFTQLKNNGAPAVEETVFQVAASPDGLYFAFRAADKSIKARPCPRDGAVWHDDALEVFLTPDDPLPDDPNVRSGRHFLFNPAGSCYDDSFLAGVSEQRWNSDWKVAVDRTADGYTAELFLPYYAFEFQQPGKRWRFNVGRENYTGETLEISVWSPCNAFMQMDKYASLEVPEFDVSRYNWRLSNLALKVVPDEKGIKKLLSGKLTGPASGKLSLQAVARQEGKVAALNRAGLSCSEQGECEFSMPLALNGSGQFQLSITGRDNQGKVLYHEAELTLESVPFSFRITHPVYRKTLYADDTDRTLSASVSFAGDKALLEGVTVNCLVKDANGKELYRTHVAAANTVLTIDCKTFVPGDYTLTVNTSGKESLTGTIDETFSIAAAPEAGNCVRINAARQTVLNGKPFFPRGFLGGSYEPELFEMLSKSGCNVFHFYMLSRLSLEEIQTVLDRAEKYNLKVIMYPFHQTGAGFFGFKEGAQESPRLSPAARERMITMVNSVKKHPAFFAWYLYDEPRGAEYCDELRAVYRKLREIDPYHPVIGLDCSASGCIEKQSGFCDLHILDLYPNPRQDGTYKTPPSAVIGSMKAVNTSVGEAAVWFCPQAFDGRNFEPESDARTLTYQEIRALCFGTIINGATAITPYKIGNMALEYYQNDQNAGIFYAPELKIGYLKGVIPELAALENILLSPVRSGVKASPKELLVMEKYNGSSFIFAVNPENRPMQGEISGCPGTTYRVLGEKRSVTADGGVIHDDFAPFAVHIYTTDNNFANPVDIVAIEAEIAEAAKK